jgi:hypothetical protein
MVAARKDQNIAYQKIVTLIEQLLDQSVVYEMDYSDLVYDTFSQYGNNLITLPVLNEMSLIAALHSKFNVIVSSNTHVDRIKMKDTNDNLQYEFTMVDEDEYLELPRDDVWSTELSYFSGCWWQRNDVNTMDKNASSQEEYEEWCKVKQENNVDEQFKSLFMEIEKQIDSFFASGSENPADVIDVDFEKNTWKPKLVD